MIRDPWLWSSLLAFSIMGQPLGVHWDTADKEKTKLLWVRGAEAVALTNRAQVTELLDRCQESGINALALEVKLPSGQMLFANRESKPNFDLLLAATEEASKRHIRVEAVVNLFVEGTKKERFGPAYDHPRWASIVFDQTDFATLNGREWGVCRLGEERPGISLIPPSEQSFEGQSGVLAAVSESHVSALLDNPRGVDMPVPKNGYLLVAEKDAGEVLRGLRLGDPVELRHRKQVVSELQNNAGNALHVNPALPEIQERQLNLLADLAKYPLAGILIDQSGFDSLNMDFSDTNRRTFEATIGKEVPHWPTDVFDYAASGARIPGPFYKAWIEWRARLLQDFFARARKGVKSANPKLFFGLRVRTPYAESMENGINWAKAGYQPSTDWASPRFGETGSAGLFDGLIVPAEQPDLHPITGKIPLWTMLPEEPNRAKTMIAPCLKESEGAVIVYRSDLWEKLGDSLLLE